jgi:starvation-inducible DNA-binding protein
MNTPPKTPLRTFVKLGFTHIETEEIVQSLNKLLANYHIHYQKLRNFHWNVEGVNFFELHRKFEEQYNEVKVVVDEVAERVRIFGKKPMSALSEYLQTSEIKEVYGSLTAYQMVQEMLKDFEVLLSYMMDVTYAANKIGDAGTEEMITTFIKSQEKKHWMFTSWLKGQEPSELI